MRKITLASILAASALVIAPSLASVTAAPPAEYCITVSCRSPHKQQSATICGATEREAAAKGEQWLGAHRGPGHSPSKGRVFQR